MEGLILLVAHLGDIERAEVVHDGFLGALPNRFKVRAELIDLGNLRVAIELSKKLIHHL